MPFFAHRALNAQPLDVWGGTGPWCAILFTLRMWDMRSQQRRAMRGETRIFNIGGGAGHSINDIVHTLEQLLGHAVERRVFPARAFDPPVNVLDIQRAQNELFWKPTMAFEDGVAKSVEWLRTVA